MVKFQEIFGIWGSEAEVARDFENDSVLDYSIVIAWYRYEDYEGSAYVLAEKDGKLFECEAAHCSCHGLEECWNPSEVTVAYLEQRLLKGNFVYGRAPEVAEAVRRYVTSRLLD